VLQSVPAIGRLDTANVVRLIAEGLGLAAWRFDELKRRSRTQPDLALAVGAPDEAFWPAIQRGLADADSINTARRLAAMPPNIATPDWLAAECQALADKHESITCRVYRDDELAERRMVGLINVGQGSAHPPCLIELTYQPPGQSPHCVGLVGKSITFDSGGLSLKTNAGMHGMKYDMAAGAAVVGAMHAVARLQPPCKVVGLLPAAENAVGRHAYRVDDIIEYPNGCSVEITHTDYEGRLVMADALIHACAQLKPDWLVDLGTLTGEIIQGLAKHVAGLWSDNARLADQLTRAGRDSGEMVWPMPLLDEHHQAIAASAHADSLNINLDQPGRPGQCAAFLNQFVEKGPAWAHLDIAGPVNLTDPLPPFAAGPTGYGAGLLRRLIEQL
jgi:leucyl aminopeptidase